MKKAVVVSGGALVVGAPFVGAGVAHATALTVTNLNDSGAGSLRDALDTANGNPDVDTITFQAGLTGTIELTGKLEATESVTITGPGAGAVTVDGNSLDEVFYVYHSSGANIDVTIAGLTITGGDSVYGGVVNWGENLTLSSVVVTGNTSTGHGGGVYASSYALDSGVPTLHIVGSTISNNSATGDGGGVWFGDVTGALSIVDSTITGNTGGKGGGVYVADPSDGVGVDVSIVRTDISNNTARRFGGGISFGDPDGQVEIIDCTISGNTANNDGGGIYFYDTDSYGSLTIKGTTVSGNTAADQGGGIYLYQLDTPTLIENSTIANNTSTDGGGIFLYNSFYGVTVSHSTVAGNFASGDAGGVGAGANAGSVTIANSIVASNTAAGLGDDLLNGSATVTVNYSLIGSVDSAVFGGANNITDVDAQLGTLADNGGLTLTIKPLAGSPAIDAGDPAFAAPPGTDQRGAARVFNGRVDMGSVEVGSELPPTGGSNGLMAAIGAALLGLGGVMHLGSKRRRSEA